MPAAHPAEFRRRAVELARLREKPVAAIARDSGISDLCPRNLSSTGLSWRPGSPAEPVARRGWGCAGSRVPRVGRDRSRRAGVGGCISRCTRRRRRPRPGARCSGPRRAGTRRRPS